jgi:type II secretory pathway component PulM
VVLGSVQEMSDKVTLPTVAGTEGLSPASTGNSQSPRNGVSALWHAFAAKAAKIVEGIAEDYLLLLLVVLLLLIWYYLKSRRRDQETYQYDQQKRYTSRKVISLQT